MLVTEEEAKARWCPFARALRSGSTGMAAANRDGEGMDARTKCLASKCMAWRWASDGGWRLADDRAVHSLPAPKEPSVRVGFCGLASSTPT